MAFIISSFARVPEPEDEYRHQSNSMTLLEYLAKVGSHIDAGAPIARLENWWARFEVRSNVPARVAKNLYDWVPGINLAIGSEIALLVYDEDLPKGKSLFSTHVVSVKREKKGKNGG